MTDHQDDSAAVQVTLGLGEDAPALSSAELVDLAAGATPPLSASELIDLATELSLARSEQRMQEREGVLAPADAERDRQIVRLHGRVMAVAADVLFREHAPR